MDYKDMLDIMSSQADIGIKYHICKSGRIPNRLALRDFDKAKWKDFKNYVEENFRWEKENRFHLDEICSDNQETDYALYLESGITISSTYLEFIYLIFDERSDPEILKTLKKKFKNLKKQKCKQEIGVIRTRRGSLGVKFFEYKLYENDFIKLMGDELVSFYNEMVSNLKSDHGSGLYLLYGKPGTGKTSFIKRALSEIDKKALFISPSYTEHLTSPNLISLLMDHPDSILVIEDAETAIMERKADNSSSVSNLLNLTDGFLSDFLNLKIICTFNTELDDIDSALLRNGRLKGMHEFTELDSKNVQKVASLLEVEIPNNEPMTIAEICNVDKQVKKSEQGKIGFNY